MFIPSLPSASLANGLVAFVLVVTGMLSQAAWLAVALACLLTVVLRRPRADLGLNALTLCLLAVSVCFLGDDFRSAFLRVFTTSDAVYSWNRWALDWFSGTLPVFSMSYPQSSSPRTGRSSTCSTKCPWRCWRER